MSWVGMHPVVPKRFVKDLAPKACKSCVHYMRVFMFSRSDWEPGKSSCCGVDKGEAMARGRILWEEQKKARRTVLFGKNATITITPTKLDSRGQLIESEPIEFKTSVAPTDSLPRAWPVSSETFTVEEI